MLSEEGLVPEKPWSRTELFRMLALPPFSCIFINLPWLNSPLFAKPENRPLTGPLWLAHNAYSILLLPPFPF